MRTYAIGDIHGHVELLTEVHARIAADREATGDTESPILHLGDLVDRGPDSRGVIQYLREGIERGENWLVIKGNHDRMFYEFMKDARWRDPGMKADLGWLNPRLGGDKTLASYGVEDAFARPIDEVHDEAMQKVPEEDLTFLEGLPLWIRRGEALFVHAGIRPGVAMEDQVENDLVWIRDGFLDDTRDHGFLVVHGHTALDKPTHYGNRVNLDSSAAYGGPLTCAIVEGREVTLLLPDGKVPLRP